MGLTQNRGTSSLGSIGSTKVLNVGATTVAYTIDSGMVAIEVTNVGDSAIWYGDSTLVSNSGGFLAVHSSKYWDNVVDNFTIYFVCPAASAIAIHEYKGR